jgi:hypothetical protein
MMPVSGGLGCSSACARKPTHARAARDHASRQGPAARRGGRAGRGLRKRFLVSLFSPAGKRARPDRCSARLERKPGSAGSSLEPPAGETGRRGKLALYGARSSSAPTTRRREARMRQSARGQRAPGGPEHSTKTEFLSFSCATSCATPLNTRMTAACRCSDPQRATSAAGRWCWAMRDQAAYARPGSTSSEPRAAVLPVDRARAHREATRRTGAGGAARAALAAAGAPMLRALGGRFELCQADAACAVRVPRGPRRDRARDPCSTTRRRFSPGTEADPPRARAAAGTRCACRSPDRASGCAPTCWGRSIQPQTSAGRPPPRPPRLGTGLIPLALARAISVEAHGGRVCAREPMDPGRGSDHSTSDLPSRARGRGLTPRPH